MNKKIIDKKDIIHQSDSEKYFNKIFPDNSIPLKKLFCNVCEKEMRSSCKDEGTCFQCGGFKILNEKDIKNANSGWIRKGGVDAIEYETGYTYGKDEFDEW